MYRYDRTYMDIFDHKKEAPLKSIIEIPPITHNMPSLLCFRSLSMDS
jgi:hypothetical protein